MAVTLASISIFYKDRTEAMVAVVEPQVTAISYRKAVVIEKIHVIPGQEVREGQMIIEVARPDLELDLEKLTTELSRIEIEFETLESQHQQKVQLEKIEYQSERYGLESAIAQEKLEIEQNKRFVAGLNELTAQNLASDSIRLLQLKVLENQLEKLDQHNQEGQIQENLMFQKERAILEKQMDLVSKELDVIKSETADLVRHAQAPGTIGAINVQLGELIPPYRTMITIYGSQPSMIRAFMNEEISYQVKVGDAVWIESENRLYKVPGEVVEIGSRITSFPNKINPNPENPRYGQEVYVLISGKSRFLSGEKVFVYPVDVQ